MRNLIYVMLMVFLPLTLASDTQHRFKVYVSVGGGGDETTTSLLTSHFKRELRALGDVDIVGYDDDWGFRIRVSYVEHTRASGVKTGDLSIASVSEERLYKHYLKDFVQQDIIKPVIPDTLWVSVWSKDALQEWCIWAAGKFNDDTLEFHRSIRK